MSNKSSNPEMECEQVVHANEGIVHIYKVKC